MDLTPRDIEVASAADRAAALRTTGGRPRVEFEGQSTPYIDYESIDVLLSLQHPRSGRHDEMTFFIAGQVIELLFKLAVHEVQACQSRLDVDDVDAALVLLRRIATIEQLLVDVWPTLQTLTPNDFNAFRDHLGTASGFQSYMYRALEFCLGNKNATMLRPHRHVPHVYPQLEQVFAAPSLWDTTTALLARRGYEIDPAHLNRDVSEPYVPDDSVRAAWARIYRESEGSELFQLGEALMAVAAGFTTWRMIHLVTVERIIGSKPGSGGTSGVGWLRAIADHRFFPELWAARTDL